MMCPPYAALPLACAAAAFILTPTLRPVPLPRICLNKESVTAVCLASLHGAAVDRIREMPIDDVHRCQEPESGVRAAGRGVLHIDIAKNAVEVRIDDVGANAVRDA